MTLNDVAKTIILLMILNIKYCKHKFLIIFSASGK